LESVVFPLSFPPNVSATLESTRGSIDRRRVSDRRAPDRHGP